MPGTVCARLHLKFPCVEGGDPQNGLYYSPPLHLRVYDKDLFNVDTWDSIKGPFGYIVSLLYGTLLVVFTI